MITINCFHGFHALKFIVPAFSRPDGIAGTERYGIANPVRFGSMNDELQGFHAGEISSCRLADSFLAHTSQTSRSEVV